MKLAAPGVRAAAGLLLLAGLTSACRSLVWYGHSPDRRQRVEVRQHGRHQFVTLGRWRSANTRGVGVRALRFSPDGRRLVFPTKGPDGSWRLSERNRAPGPPFGAIGELVFSPDSQHLAYAAKQGASWRVILDGKAGPSVSTILRGTLGFDPESKRLAYVARQGQGVAVFVDQRPSALWTGVAQLRLAPGGRVLYAGRRGFAWHAVVDGKVGPSWDKIKALTSGPRGRRYVYFGLRNKRWYAVVDGRVSRPYDELAGPRFSADGQHLAWAAREGKRARVVRDLIDGPIHDGVRFETLRWDAAGQLLYVARQAKRYQLVRAGKAGPGFDAMTVVTLSRGGRHWGYVARTGKQHWLVVDDQKRSLPKTVSAAADLRLSPDGRRFAFIARRGSDQLVVHDGGAVRFDLVVAGTLVFGPDPATKGPKRWRWACLAGDRASKQLFVAVEGLGRRAFDSEELTAAAMKKRTTLPPSLLRRWVRAELRLALEGRHH